MPKLERLITLARLIQGGHNLTVRELSRECGVSERTLYRYLKTLSEMDPVVDLNPRLGQAARKSEANQLSADDAGLLQHLLENHPLSRYPHFARRIGRLVRLIGISNGRSIKGSIFDFRPDRQSRPSWAISGLIDRFLRACVEGRSVRLTLKGEVRLPRIMWPRAIRVRGEHVLLMAARTARGRPAEFELDQILQMSLCRRKRSFSEKLSTGPRQPRRKKG